MAAEKKIVGLDYRIANTIMACENKKWWSARQVSFVFSLNCSQSHQAVINQTTRWLFSFPFAK